LPLPWWRASNRKELDECKEAAADHGEVEERAGGERAPRQEAAEEGGLYHRITDQPWIENRPYAYTLKKPFDCFFLNKVKSYVAILFYTPRKDKIVYLIRIDNFLKMKEKSERKSFTEETANRFSSKVYLI